MKKFLSLFISVIMVASVTVSALASSVQYDADDDGKVTVSDARTVLRISVGLDNVATGTDAYNCADADEDGKVTVSDARLILRVAIGLENPADATSTDATGTILEKELSSSEIYKLAEGFTVEISTEGPMFTGTGSGFFIDSNGTVATNYHVIENSTFLKVTDHNGTTYDVTEIVAYDEDIDIAIIKTNAKNTSYATLSTTYSTGDTIYTLGSALGLSYTFSSGMISQAYRTIEDMKNNVKYIQISAPISNGNSGGPLLDTKGNVIGLNTLGYNDGQNLNFSVPVSYLSKLDRSDPITAEDYYYANEHGVYAAGMQLKSACYSYGTQSTDTSGYTYYELSGVGFMSSASLMYYPDYDILIVYYAKQSGLLVNTTIYSDAIYIDSSNKFDCISAVQKGSSIIFEADYTIDGNTFKSGSSVNYTTVTTNTNNQNTGTLAKQSASNVVSMVSFLKSVISSYNLPITVSDLGFSNF